mgnify:FL=1
MDMTEGVIWRQLVDFAVPLFVGNIFQQLYNTVDSVVVGNFVGADALGAVTSTVPIVFTFISLFIGMTMGASVVIAQYFGAGDVVRLRRAVHTAVVSTVVLSLVLSAAGYVATPALLRFMNTPASIMPEAATYLQIYMLGLIGLMLYNMGSAILRAVGDSLRPLFLLILSSVLNIALDLLFVISFKAGVAGVAWATILSQLVSGLVVFRLLFRSRECHSITWGEMRVDRHILRRILDLGLPSGVQLALTSFSNVFVQGYINAYGAASASGWGIYIRIDAFVFLPIQSMGMAVTTFTGQNAGALRADRVRAGVRASLGISAGITALIVAVIYASAPWMVALFNRDDEVLRYGVLFLRLNSVFDLLNVVYIIYGGALRGVGNARTPMYFMLGSFVLFRQVYLLVASRLTDSITPIALSYPAGWLLCSVLLILYVRKNGWDQALTANTL